MEEDIQELIKIAHIAIMFQRHTLEQWEQHLNRHLPPTLDRIIPHLRKRLTDSKIEERLKTVKEKYNV